MPRKKKKASPGGAMLPKSALYGRSGTSLRNKASKQSRDAIKKMSTGTSLASRPDHKQASSAISQSQKEAKIRQLMKDRNLTYAQAAIELME